MCFLVNFVKERIQSELVEKLYKVNEFRAWIVSKALPHFPHTCTVLSPHFRPTFIAVVMHHDRTFTAILLQVNRTFVAFMQHYSRIFVAINRSLLHFFSVSPHFYRISSVFLPHSPRTFITLSSRLSALLSHKQFGACVGCIRAFWWKRDCSREHRFSAIFSSFCLVGTRRVSFDLASM